jgi:hypothetical protein
LAVIDDGRIAASFPAELKRRSAATRSLDLGPTDGG